MELCVSKLQVLIESTNQNCMLLLLLLWNTGKYLVLNNLIVNCNINNIIYFLQDFCLINPFMTHSYSYSSLDKYLGLLALSKIATVIPSIVANYRYVIKINDFYHYRCP
jgi:hypothetical protein